MGSGVVRQAQQELPDHQPVPRWVLAVCQQQLLQVQQADSCVQVCCRDDVPAGSSPHVISSLALEGVDRCSTSCWTPAVRQHQPPCQGEPDRLGSRQLEANRAGACMT